MIKNLILVMMGLCSLGIIYSNLPSDLREEQFLAIMLSLLVYGGSIALIEERNND